MEFILMLLAATSFLWGALLHDADAATQSSVSYLHGDGYASGDDTRNNLRFDATKVGDYGMVYGRADVSSFDDANSIINTRVIGHAGVGVHLAGQVVNANRVSNTSVGVGYSQLTKGYRYGIDVYKMQSNAYGDGIHTFAFAAFPIAYGFEYDGFIEHIARSEGAAITFGQSALNYRIDNMLVGAEWQHAINKNGIKGLNESAPQLRVKWEF